MTDVVLVAAQSTRSIIGLESWVAKKPGRRVAVEIADGRWRATLADAVEVGGNSLSDVLAQAATIATMGEEPAT